MKKILTSSDILVHFEEKPLVVTNDASNERARAVLSHDFPDGTLRLIVLASRSFSNVEKRYSAIIKQAMGHKVPPVFVWKSFRSRYGSHSVGAHF